MSVCVEVPTRLLGWIPVEAAIASRLATHVVSTPEASVRPLTSVAPKVVPVLSPADVDDFSTGELREGKRGILRIRWTCTCPR